MVSPSSSVSTSTCVAASGGGGGASGGVAAAVGGRAATALWGVPYCFTGFKIQDFVRDLFTKLPALSLHNHILNGRKAEVLAIICAKESLKVTEPQYKLTPLHLAVIVKNIDIVRILLENGAEVNTRDANGWTALHHAMVLGDEAIITLLKEKGAADDILDPRNGTPADLYSLVHGKVDPMAQHFFYRKKVT